MAVFRLGFPPESPLRANSGRGCMRHLQTSSAPAFRLFDAVVRQPPSKQSPPDISGISIFWRHRHLRGGMESGFAFFAWIGSPIGRSPPCRSAPAEDRG
jgi:hypothetical protein